MEDVPTVQTTAGSHLETLHPTDVAEVTRLREQHLYLSTLTFLFLSHLFYRYLCLSWTVYYYTFTFFTVFTLYTAIMINTTTGAMGIL